MNPYQNAFHDKDISLSKRFLCTFYSSLFRICTQITLRRTLALSSIYLILCLTSPLQSLNAVPAPLTFSKLFTRDLTPYLLVFARLGIFLMIMPGIGSAFIPGRIRVLCALGLSAALAPTIFSERIPKALSLHLLFGEMLTGGFMALVALFLWYTLETAGAIISHQTALSNVFIPTANTHESSIWGRFLGLAGIALIFTSDTHHIFIRSLLKSYQIFPPGSPPNISAMLTTLVNITHALFYHALQMAAPILAISLTSYLMLGIFNRLVPQIHVFFIAQPLEIFLGILMLTGTITAILTLFSSFFQETWMNLFLPHYP